MNRNSGLMRCLTLAGKALVILLFVGIAASVIGLFVLERQFNDADNPLSSFDLTPPQQRITPDGIEFLVDNSFATFQLDLDPNTSVPDLIFPSHAAALAYAREKGLEILPSVGLVHDKCKKANDAIIRALESATQSGRTGDTLPGRRAALRKLALLLTEELQAASPDMRPCFENALVYVAGALAAGGAPLELPEPVAQRVDADVAEFFESPIASRPIGFWDESEHLRQIFYQDRFLASGLVVARNAGACVALAGVILDDPLLHAAFIRNAEFGARLTNPPSDDRLSPVRLDEFAAPGQSWSERMAPDRLTGIRDRFDKTGGTLALVAYSFSHEESLLRKMPSGFSAKDLVRAVKQGILDLEPTQDSGWYDYQWHALETLLLPEHAREHSKLLMSRKYKNRLSEVFLAAVAKDRESHIKNLPVMMMGISDRGRGDVEAEVGPEFAVEPLPTVYLRFGRAYRFLNSALTVVLGDWLDEIRMIDLFESDSEVSVREAVERMAMLNYGLNELACRDIGLSVAYLEGECDSDFRLAAVAFAEDWLARIEQDPDLALDARIAVPMFEDWDFVRMWACAGVRLERVVARYKEKPRVNGVIPIFVPSCYWVGTDVFLEFNWSGPPMTRDEFRALCDQHQSEHALRATLGAAPMENRTLLRSPRLPAWLAIISCVAVFFVLWRCASPKIRRLTKRFLISAVITVVLLGVVVLAVSPRLRTRFLVEYILAPSKSQVMAVCAASYYTSARHRSNADSRREAGRIRGLLEVMDTGQPQARYTAAYIFLHLNDMELGSILEPQWAIPLLYRVAEDSVPISAATAVSLLAEFDDPGYVPLLQRKLRSELTHPEVRMSALFSAAELVHPDLFEDIWRIARNGGVIDGPWAIRALSKYTDPQVIDCFEYLLEYRRSQPVLIRSVVAALANLAVDSPERWHALCVDEAQKARVELKLAETTADFIRSNDLASAVQAAGLIISDTVLREQALLNTINSMTFVEGRSYINEYYLEDVVKMLLGAKPGPYGGYVFDDEAAPPSEEQLSPRVREAIEAARKRVSRPNKQQRGRRQSCRRLNTE